MQKLVKMLEKYVEWIALGLGAVWVLWVVWAYWISAPVSKEIGGKIVTPATIDSELIEPEAKQLANRLSQPAPKELKPLELTFSMKQPVPEPLTAVAVDSRPAEAVRARPQQERPQPTDIQPANIALKTLPKAVIPVPVTVTYDRTQVMMPLPAAAPAAAPAVALAATGLNGVPKDIRYASMFAWFNVKQQDAEFAKVGIPAPAAGELRSFFALEAVLQRQEVDADGKDIGSPVIIPLLPNRTPAPDRKADLAQFVTWVTGPQIQAEILNPPFLETTPNSTTWQGVDPATGLPIPKVVQQVVMPNAPVDPFATAPGIGDNPFDAQSALSFYNTLTPADQKTYKSKLKYANRTALEKAESDAKRATRQQTPGRTGRSGLRGDAQDPALLNELYAQAAQNPPPGQDTRPDWLRNPYGTNPGGRRSLRPGGRPALRPTPQPGIQPGMPPVFQPGMPAGAFLQPNKDGNILIFAHDITGEPGKTYKYRIKLVIMNPLYQNPAAAPELAKILELDAQFSDWTKPVTLPTDTELFFAGAEGKRDAQGLPVAAKFVVHRFQNGQINPSPELVANPGDRVGFLDKATNVDYTTGWIVADIDRSGERVTLVSTDGSRTIIRTQKDDKAKIDAAAVSAANTAAAGPDAAAPVRSIRRTLRPTN